MNQSAQNARLGIDIGTTSISIVALNVDTGENIHSITSPNNTTLPPDGEGASLQDPEGMLDIVSRQLKQMQELLPQVSAIGITGQMHGIVLTDKAGKAVSPAYTWLDARGSWKYKAGQTYAQGFAREFGSDLANGYGLLTLYCLVQSGICPSNACGLASIPSYIAMQLAGGVEFPMGQTLAHSLGCYSLKTRSFNINWKQLVTFPQPPIAEAASSSAQVAEGPYKGTPLVTPEGDNQCGVLASLKNPNSSILFNIGTSSQVSFLEAESCKVGQGSQLDKRPYFNKEVLLVGAGLSGGKSFEVLTRLIEEIAQSLGTKDIDPYGLLGNLPESQNPLFIETYFAGTRADAQKRGAISGISLNNFTLANLYWGIAEGVVSELFELMGSGQAVLDSENAYSVISGNAAEKNSAIQEIIRRKSKKPMRSLADCEVAARGAAMLALAYSEGGENHLRDIAGRVIRYKP